jgi:hypothetical protein
MRITARKTSPCKCGEWIHRGDKIDWNPRTRRTIGCEFCNFTGESTRLGPIAQHLSRMIYGY